MTTKAKKPAPKRRGKPRPTYAESEKVAILAVLAANSGNISLTSRQTGVSRDKLREWQASSLQNSPEVATLKKELSDSYRAKLKRAREAGLDRMLELIPVEGDLHKVTGAVKVLSELNITEEVADDYSSRPASGVPATDGATHHQNAPAALPN